MTSDRREEGPARWAATLVRGARTAALGTLGKGSGLPYVSLVTVATDPGGSPVLLVSRLAVHTQNLLNDPRVSLMCDASSLAGGARGDNDPLALGRVTLMGRIGKANPEAVRERFLARHPNASMYVDFPDFAFYRLDVEAAHFIGGFGRIVDLKGGDLVLPDEAAGQLTEMEHGVVQHMNDDHADALSLYATALLGEKPSDWRMAGIDPEGLDLVSSIGSCRVWFEEPVTPARVRPVLIALADKARKNASGAAG